MPKIPFWIFILLAVLYFTSTRVDVMDVDASQYAEISREMMVSGDYLHIYDRGVDYLDKPPFLFWVSAASMKVLGVNNFGYKFPSILFALLAVFATYRLARLLYDEKTGRMAALILGTCQGLFLWTNDIRTDTILMSWIIVAIWLIKEWEIKKQLKYLLLGCATIASGMMTKGPVALMVPVFCFSIDWILKRQWKNFLRTEYLLGLVVIGILLLPMCIGLYQQFDLHPEKIMNGKTHVSGLRFFFWTQSFGRITGENVWDNGAPFSFLFENMLWSFLPWILLFATALLVNVKELVQQKFRLTPQQEWITTGGFIITYLSLASSHYQLPHYILVAFPLAAIMVAKILKDFFDGQYKQLYIIFKPTQIIMSVLILIAALLTFAYIFEGEKWLYILWGGGFAIWLFTVFYKKIKGTILWGSVVAMMVANIFMTNHFYYTLLHFQAGSQLGRFILKHNIPASSIKIFMPNDPYNSLSFYAKRTIPVPKNDTVFNAQKGDYIVTGKEGMNYLLSHGILFEVASHGYFYKVSELTMDFINPEKREAELKNYYLIKINGSVVKLL